MTTNAKPKKRKLKKLIVWFLILLIIAGGCFYVYKSLKKEYTVNYDSYTATIGSISNSMSFSGNLALVSSETLTSKSSTTVRTVYVSAGDTVKDGDKIMRLNNGELIEAGIDGTVNTINFNAGDSVMAGDALAQIADFSHLKATFRVDEYDINNVSVGQSCNLTVTALERQLETSIAAINYISSSGGNVAYYSVTAYVDVDEGIYPGMQITVSIPQESAENVVILKADALSFDVTNSAYVYMYGEDGVTMEKVSVEIGVSNGNYVEIKSGLKDGDVVYVESKVEETSSGGLLSGLFGSTNVNAPSGSFPGGGSMPDFSSGNMPSFGGSSGGFPGGSGSGSSSGSSRGGSSGGFGGFGGPGQ